MSGTTNSIGDLDIQSRPEPAPGISRMMSAGVSAALEQFNDPALLNEGKINLIALDAVVERLGERWPIRRAQVHDHVERLLQKNLGQQGYFLRVSDTDFLICQPEIGRFSGQAASLRCLREILHHFMGDAAEADNCVHQVTKVGSSEVSAQKVDARHVEREEIAEQAQMAATAAAGMPRKKTDDRWSPFVASDGRELRVSCVLEPVFELKSFGRIGFRMSRRVLVVATNEEVPPGVVNNLSRADILRVDLATIARGMDRMSSEGERERQPSLIVPVSFTSLSNQQSRAQVVALLKEANSLVKQGVICEVCDIEGVPQGALLSAVSLIRPFSLFVVGRLGAAPPTNATLTQLKGAGLQALSFECPHNQGEAEFMVWAKAAIDAAKRVCKSVLIYRTDSARNAGMAGLMGATHASVRN